MTAGRSAAGSRARRWLAAASVLLLGGLSWVTASPAAVAAPLPATYSAGADGTILSARSALLLAPLAATDLVRSVATTDSTIASPALASSANLGVRVGPIGAGLTNTETAPPTHSASGSLVAAQVAGLINSGVITYTDDVAWGSANACVGTGVPLSRSFTQTAGASVGLLGVGVVSTGVSSVTTTTSLVQTSAVHDTRAVVATTSGNVAGLALLNGLVTVSALQPNLTATATSGAAGSASLTGSAVQVTAAGIGTVTLAPGANLTVSVPLVGSVVLHLASNAEVTSAGGTFSTAYLTAAITLLAGTGTVNLDLLPLSVRATAPTGGVECDTTAPAVAITTPANGSTTGDSTPAVTGTSEVLGGSISLTIDGAVPITVPTDASGNWTSTPTVPLGNGPHTAVATATDAASNVATATSAFTVNAPTVAISAPPDGSTTNDTTPTVTGTSSVLSGSVSLVLDSGAAVPVPTDAGGAWSYTPPTPFAEGPHTAAATATDGGGNSASASSSFTVDTIAPVVAITAPANGSSTNDTTPAITGTSDIISGTVSLSIDGAAPVSVPTGPGGAWVFTPPVPLGSGSHTAVVTATDPAGNVGTATSTFTVDTVAPVVAITTPVNGSTTNDNTPAVTGTSDVLSGTITLTIDGAAPVGVATLPDGSWTLTPAAPLGEGPHTAVATATDPAGNVGTATSSFTVDTVAPVVAISSPADGSTINDPTPAITGTSGVLSGSITLALDGAPAVSVVTGADGSWSFTVAAPLTDGPHTVVATATDPVGNTSTATSSFTLDATAPLLAIVTPPDGSSTNDATPAITGTSDVLSGTISVVIDAAAPVSVPTDGTGAWTYTPTAPLTDSSHTIVATATDPAGNSTSASSTFTVDTTAPAVAVVAPANGSSTNDTTPAIAGTSDALAGTVSLTIDALPTVVVPTDGSGAWTYTSTAPLADGPHTATVTATDGAGNTATATSAFSVDTVAPVVGISAPADGSTITSSTPAVTGSSDILSGTVSVVIDGDPAVDVPTGPDGSWTFTPAAPLTDGSHTAAATATDPAGNTTTATSTFTVDTQAPVIAVTAPADGSSIADPTPEITGTSDVLSGSISLVIDSGAAVIVTTGPDGSWTHTPATPLADGPHTAAATATDLAGNSSTATSGFTVDATAPLLAITAPVTGSSTNDPTPTITGTSDVLSGSISLAIDGGAAVVVPTGPDGAWTITPATPLADGPHTAVATATDGVGNVTTATTEFTVDTAAPVIAITAPQDGSTTSDTTPSLTGTSDVLIGSISLTVDGGAPITVTTAADGAWTTTLTTPLTDGPHTAVATATDAAGNTATATSGFTVDTIAPAIAITDPTDGSSTNDPTPTITGTSDILSGSITLVIDGGLPVPVTTDATGAWTTALPTPLADGPHTAAATATDAAGNTSTATSGFTVDTVAPVVAITTPAVGSTTNDPTPTITGTSDIISGSISLTIDGGAPITVTTGPDGAWTHTPATALADGPHTATATATDLSGNSTTATSGFVVDTVSPAIAITAPADGSTTADATPTITGTSDVLSGSITLVIDGGAPVPVTTDAAGAWTTTLSTPLGDGPHTVAAEATDAAGNTTTATTVFTVDTTGPAVAVTTPADGSSTNDATPTISGTSDVLSGTVLVSVDGGPGVSVTTGPNGTWTHPPAVALTDGAHAVSVTATDPTGNTTTATSSFTVDTIAPVIAITAPVDGATTNDPTPDITGSSDVLSGTILVVIDGGTPVPVTTGSDGGWTLAPASWPDGPHTVAATATDAAGNTTTTSAVTFTVDTAAPAVAITSPVDGDVTASPPSTVSGTSDVINGVVLVSIDGAPPVRVATDATGVWTLPITAPLPDGDHTVTATATDAAGNTGTATVTFTLDTTAPTVTIPVPANGSTTTDTTPLLSGTSTGDDGTVELSIDGGAVIIVPTQPALPRLAADALAPLAAGSLSPVAALDRTATWTYTPTSALALGAHTATATVFDLAGNTASASTTFTIVAAPLPDLVVTTPTPGQDVTDTTPTIAGTSSILNGTVRVVIDGTAYTVATGADGRWSFTPSAPLSCARHTVAVTATNAAGDTRVDVAFTITCGGGGGSGGSGGSTRTSGGNSSLPNTGTAIGALLVIALGLIGVGGALTGRTRRSR